MRRPSDLRQRNREGGRNPRWAIFAITGALLFLVFSLRGIAGIYTDFLWFDSLGLSSLWTGRLQAQIFLTALLGGAFFIVSLTNLWVADRLAPAPAQIAALGDDDVVKRYRALVGARLRLIRLLVAGGLTFFVTAQVPTQWQNWLLFTNGESFGINDAEFGQDIGFYVFRLPFLSFFVDWLFFSVLIVTFAVLIAHYVNGGIRTHPPGPRTTPQVKAHLSLLLGVLALTRALGYWIERYQLTTSTRGFVDGATYTDVKAQKPALELLAVMSVMAFVLLIANIRMRGWTLPAVAVGVWAFVSIVANTAYPAIIQQVRVKANEATLEAPYIERNIAATRSAYGLDTIVGEQFTNDASGLSPATAAANEASLSLAREWDPQVSQAVFQFLQGNGLRPFLDIADVDLDRYEINGELQPVLIGARDLRVEAIPNDTWTNRHLQYTHGYGVAMAPVDQVVDDGQPNFNLSNIPLSGEPQVDQPRLYIGEGLTDYAVVNTQQAELSFAADDAASTFNYDGDGGVQISSRTRQLAFALRFGDYRLATSGQIETDSRIMYNRDVRDRVVEVAPFLSWDADPYPVVIDGTIQWIIDGYTTSDHYPYSQFADVQRISTDSGLFRRFNYARNSVKGVVDAYTGDVTLYVVDDVDPIVKAWQTVFPDVFADEAASDALQAQFKYPSDFFAVQSQIYGRYRLSDTSAFYSEQDRWQPAPDPGVGAPGAVGQATPIRDATTGAAIGQTLTAMPPIEQFATLPGDDKASFIMLQPLVQAQGSNEQSDRSLTTTGFLTVSSDVDNYGQLRIFEIPSTQRPPSPVQAAGSMNADSWVSQYQTLVGNSGSQVILGQIVVIPIRTSEAASSDGDEGWTLLYMRPLFITADGRNQPRLSQVIVQIDDRVRMRPSFERALSAVLDPTSPAKDPNFDAAEIVADPSTPTTTEPLSTTTTSSSITVPAGVVPPGSDAERLVQIRTLLADAEAARQRGDFATYQTKVSEANALASS